MPADPITTLVDRRVLNMIVNERIKPFTALTNLVFPASTKENLFEETAQIDVLEGTYDMAPFVKIGQKAVMVKSLNGTSYTVDTPFINIVRPLDYSTKLAKRMVGQNVFSKDPATIKNMVRTAIEQDADFMNTITDNRIEWMIAFLLRGQISYSVEGQDSFVINTGKPSANTFTVSTLWSSSSAVPLEDITDMKKVVSKRRGAIPNIGICGATAAKQLRRMLEAKEVTAIQTTSGIEAAKRVTLIADITADGMIHIGNIGGVDFFEYLGTFLADGTGTETALIRASYIEFFSNAPKAMQMRKFMFGMIPDLLAIMEGNAITERYMSSKAPDVDQGVYKGYLKTRPFPWFYRPDWNVSMKVI